jgi:hypothetical protein
MENLKKEHFRILNRVISIKNYLANYSQNQDSVSILYRLERAQAHLNNLSQRQFKDNFEYILLGNVLKEIDAECEWCEEKIISLGYMLDLN